MDYRGHIWITQHLRSGMRIQVVWYFFIPSHDIEFTSHLNDYNSSNNLLGSHANGYYMNFVL